MKGGVGESGQATKMRTGQVHEFAAYKIIK